MDETTKQILEIVTNIQDKMATRSDLEETRRGLQMQITENTKAIAELSEQIRNVFGYSKEIDLLMERVSALERQAGIK